MSNNRPIKTLLTFGFLSLAPIFASTATSEPTIAQTPVAAPGAAEDQKLRAEAKSVEIANLKTQTEIAENVRRTSNEELATKGRDAKIARRQAAQDIGQAQKKHQELLRVRERFEKKAQKREKELEERRLADEKRKADEAAKKATEEERKTTVTQILSELFDARKIQTEASELTALEKLQDQLKLAEEKLSNAQKIHATWIAGHTEPISQAQEAINDIGASVGKIKEMVQKATLAASTPASTENAR